MDVASEPVEVCFGSNRAGTPPRQVMSKWHTRCEVCGTVFMMDRVSTRLPLHEVPDGEPQ